MENLIELIGDLLEELTVLEEDENFDKSQLDDIVYELDNLRDLIAKSIED